MADPISIIGTVGSIVNIIEVLGKTISTIHELCSQWREADFTFVNLIAQLTALKAALNKIQEWMDAEVVEPHHQLVMDLEVSMSCCRMLIGKMDAHVSELHQSSHNTLNYQSKMELMVEGGTLEGL
jgi:hypothetical protein